MGRAALNVAGLNSAQAHECATIRLAGACCYTPVKPSYALDNLAEDTDVMPFLETPSTFYIGRRYDLATRQVTSEPTYYVHRDLLTHAVIVGMTGSGKTGLGIALAEEAILDNIPVIAIDPKGDLTNLLLTFPQLRPEDFAPWINPDDARRAGTEPGNYASVVAEQWRKGLAAWDIVPGRIGAMQRAAQFSIYTPGSDAGLPLRILDSLNAPREGWAGYEEFHRERIDALTTAILALIGKEAEPVRDREHVLITNIIERAWQAGQDLTLESLIQQVLTPPFQTLGVFELEKFFPTKDRNKLALALNQIIASPSFQSWLHGDPLDAEKLLFDANGRPRVSVLYVAHLSDSERIFVITMILEAILSWMRSLGGTNSLRALIYFDELFGFFPPAPHNPPTKEPLLRLLKNARAFGIGLALATQNPIDLDYKGLSNAGSWFIGKLQTENDKQRVLNGLQSVATAQMPLNVPELDRLLSNLGPQVFVLNNVHEQTGPMLFHTRWTMSYLHGPMTRPQISQLMAAQRQSRTAAAPPGPPVAPVMKPIAPRPTTTMPQAPVFTPPHAATPASATPPPPLTIPESSPKAAPAAGGTDTAPPKVPAEIDQFFITPTLNADTAVHMWSNSTNTPITAMSGAHLIYHPALLAQVAVRFLDRKTHLEEQQTLAYLLSDPGKTGLVRWSDNRVGPFPVGLLGHTPAASLPFAPLPASLTDAKRLNALKTDVIDYVYRSATLPVYYHAGTKLVSQPGESRDAYLARLQTAFPPEQTQNAEAWAKITAAVEEMTLSPHRKDIDIAQFGIAWLPGWDITVNGQAVSIAAY
ncbi:MAG: ATP-binding protein [Aggregatilineales bacterium]